jgi:hypothetical protein
VQRIHDVQKTETRPLIYPDSGMSRLYGNLEFLPGYGLTLGSNSAGRLMALKMNHHP